MAALVSFQRGALARGCAAWPAVIFRGGKKYHPALSPLILSGVPEGLHCFITDGAGSGVLLVLLLSLAARYRAGAMRFFAGGAPVIFRGGKNHHPASGGQRATATGAQCRTRSLNDPGVLSSL